MPIYVSDDIVLKDNKISTAQSNANVLIEPNGSGALQIDGVNISGNTITTNSSNANLELTANSSGYVKILGTGALGVPVGTTAQRTSGVAGQLRLNTTTSTFEGYDGTSWGSLAGSTDAEADTNNTLRVTKTSIGTTITTVDSFTVSEFRGVKYNYVIFDEVNNEFETGFIHLTHDETTSYHSQYGITHTGSSTLGTFTTDISGTTVRLRFTGASTTSSITLFRTGLGDNTAADSDSVNTGVTINTDVDSAQESLDTTDASTYRAVQYFILAQSTTGDDSTVGYEVFKVNVTHDGSTAYHSVYGRTSTTSADILSIDVDINSGNIRLLGSAATANVTVKIYKIMVQDSEDAATGDNVSIIVNDDVDSAIENVDTFENDPEASTTYQAAHYFNSVKASAGVGGAEYQVSEVVVVGDGGNNIFESEFGIVHSGNRQLITYSTDHNNTTARLRGVGATTNLVVNGYRVNLSRPAGGVTASSVVLTESDQTIQGQKTFSSEVILNSISSSDSSSVTVNDNLKVTGLSTDNAFLINAGDGTIGETTALTVDPASNYLGINQTSPEVTLHMTGSGAQTTQIRMEQYNDSADAPDVRTRRYRGTEGSPSGVQAGDYLFRSNHEYWNGSALIVGGSFAFDNTNDANKTQFAVAVSTDGTTADPAGNNGQFIIDGNAGGRIKMNTAVALAVNSDPATITDYAHIYAKDEASSAEVFVKDEAGNVTKISPHNEQGEWEYYSRNVKTGKTVRINMEEMIRDIEKLTGKSYIKND